MKDYVQIKIEKMEKTFRKQRQAISTLISINKEQKAELAELEDDLAVANKLLDHYRGGGL